MFYSSLEEMVVSTAEAVRPAERLTVAQAAAKYRQLNNPGAYVGPWLNETTPYLTEPMEVLTDLRYTGMVFVGPAQCGKTDIYLNWHLFTVLVDPADMMLVQTSQTAASDFSKRRVDRLHEHTPIVRDRLLPGRNHDNTFDKRYAGGAMITLSWPTVNELSGKPIPRVFLTDYDRMDQNVGGLESGKGDKGNGTPWALAKKRTTTFRRHGMTVAESSPSFPVTNPNYIRQSAHEAPPAEGILSLYNLGDRRRWYWTCVRCRNGFEPGFSLLKYPDSKDPVERGELARLECPHCATLYSHEAEGDLPGKHELNRRGFWLRDGEKVTPDGEILGKPFRSTIASFWLKGAAAAFADWKDLVTGYVQAEEEYARTGSEHLLRSTVNLDQGEPYLPKSSESDRLPEELKARAKDFGQREVPLSARFLLATVDVQKNRFVVQVHAISEGADIGIVDRFDIRKSARLDADGEHLWVNPGAYAEDWRLLVKQVILKSYPLGDGSGRRMGVKVTACDSGGREGVTANAYNFWRWLRTGPDADEKVDDTAEAWVPGLHTRFQLLKGGGNRMAPRVRIEYPDSERKDRHAGARGEVPVMMLNTDELKNELSMRLGRTAPRGGRINFPDWLPMNFYTELCVEVKNSRTGKWENPKRFRNESWDLLTYCLGLLLSARHVGVDTLNWAEPPGWAAPWDENDLVFDPAVAEAIAISPRKRYDLGKLAEELG